MKSVIPTFAFLLAKETAGNRFCQSKLKSTLFDFFCLTNAEANAAKTTCYENLKETFESI
jgi:hypothetical protein